MLPHPERLSRLEMVRERMLVRGDSDRTRNLFHLN
jgi:hypothetical protein